LVVGTVGFPLIRIVDATVAVAVPLDEKASTPGCRVSVENCWLTVMLVPGRVVIVADPTSADAKMPEVKLPSTLIVPLR
jgi:hypothetical protein